MSPKFPVRWLDAAAMREAWQEEGEPSATMTSESEAPTATPSVRSSLAMVRDIAFIVAVYAYSTGFTYYYFWRLLLGIPVTVADEPVFHIFVYAFQVFHIYWIGILGCIIGGLKESETNCRQRSTHLRPTMSWCSRSQKGRKLVGAQFGLSKYREQGAYGHDLVPVDGNDD
jgi:hypothetical protein